jgi:hypothetical protein
MFKSIKDYLYYFWVDLFNKTDKNGFSKKMREAKRKLDKLHKGG